MKVTVKKRLTVFIIMVLALILTISSQANSRVTAITLLERFNKHYWAQMEITPVKVANGRDFVEAYRSAHIFLHSGGWYKGISENHLPLLQILVNNLEKEGYTSTRQVFEEKTPEVLDKFFIESRTIEDSWQ